MNTVQQLAHQLSRSFESREGKDGQRFLKDCAPEWMKDAIYSAASDTDRDTAYDFVETAADTLGDSAYGDDPDFDEMIGEIEADVYTMDLVKWLASDYSHAERVDRACEEFGVSDKTGIIERIQIGQMEHKREVAYLLLRFIQDLSEKLDQANDIALDTIEEQQGEPQSADNDYWWMFDNNQYSRD